MGAKPSRDGAGRGSIRFRLTVWYGSALAGLLLLVGLAVYGLLAASLRRDAEQQLAQRATQIAATLNSDGSGINLQESPTTRERILVYAAGGQLLEGSSPDYRPARLPAWVPAAPGPLRYTRLALADGPWLFVAQPLPGSAAAATAGQLLVGRAYGPSERMLQQTALAFLLAGPVALLLAGLLGYFVAGRALAPVATMTRTARRIQAESLSRRLPVANRPDELSELATTFNALLARLEDAFARERRFTADAAHELRAPLAVVQAETSLALTRPRPAAEYQRVLRVVEAETVLLARLITDLLTLARGDAGPALRHREWLLLPALAQAALNQVAPRARAQHLTLAADLAEPTWVWGDATWLTQLLLNLLDNAIKYTPAGGRVSLQVRADPAGATIVVADTGAGIAAADLPHIFERFYRADTARSRAGATSGFGLGLAICTWVAQAHGGRIGVVSSPGAGACFTVSLPAAADAGPAPAPLPLAGGARPSRGAAGVE